MTGGEPNRTIIEKGAETGQEGILCPICHPGSGAAATRTDAPLSGRYVVIDLPGGYPS